MGKDCGWKHPKAPAVRKLWKEGATEAVLGFLEDTQVGCWRPAGVARLPREAEGGGVSEGEESGLGPPSGLSDYGLSLGGGEACGHALCTGDCTSSFSFFSYVGLRG